MGTLGAFQGSRQTNKHKTTQDNTRQDKTTQHTKAQDNTTQDNTRQEQTRPDNTTQHNQMNTTKQDKTPLGSSPSSSIPTPCFRTPHHAVAPKPSVAGTCVTIGPQLHLHLAPQETMSWVWTPWAPMTAKNVPSSGSKTWKVRLENSALELL